MVFVGEDSEVVGDVLEFFLEGFVGVGRFEVGGGIGEEGFFDGEFALEEGGVVFSVAVEDAFEGDVVFYGLFKGCGVGEKDFEEFISGGV